MKARIWQLESRLDKLPGYTIDNIQEATPGSVGMVRLKYKEKDKHQWQLMDWRQVDTAQAFTVQFELTGLLPDKEYDHDTWMNDAYPGMQTKVHGRFYLRITILM